MARSLRPIRFFTAHPYHLSLLCAFVVALSSLALSSPPPPPRHLFHSSHTVYRFFSFKYSLPMAHAPPSPASTHPPHLANPSLDLLRPAPVRIMPKPVHPPPTLSPTNPKKPRFDTPPTSPSRRRAPALERLPRWLFAPVRQFVSTRSELPLPTRVAVRGKPFYDWDAWALSLLRPSLWRRRGPWQRLVASCTAWKPSHVTSLETIKSSLVRIVVADVVSLLVNRSPDQLTPEDRNWITSVASRQRGRDHRKPALMLLFDLAFPLFDLALYCRCRHTSTLTSSLRAIADVDGQVAQQVFRIALESVDSSSTVADDTESDKASKQEDTATPSETKITKEGQAMDMLIVRIMEMIESASHESLESSKVATVHLVIDAIEALLEEAQAPRWYKSHSSPSQLRADNLKRIALTFVDRVPLPIMSITKENTDSPLHQWLKMALLPDHWRYWAELANDYSYINLSVADRENQARDDLRDHIFEHLLNDRVCTDESSGYIATGGTVPSVACHNIRSSLDELKVPIRKLLDIAINIEQFFALFVETHGKEEALPSDIAWLVALFERSVQDLSTIRGFLIAGSSREQSMVEWSARSLVVADYYAQAILGNSRMSSDIEKALQSAFAEASWSPQTRSIRFMVQHQCYYPPGSEKGSQGPVNYGYQFWIAALDLRDPIYQAVAIVPWDPERALSLLDDAIGLTPDVMTEVLQGRKGLPLWDFRRIAIWRAILHRGNMSQAVLILERLHRLFDQRSLHDGGNYSKDSIALLEAASAEGNLCAQTAYGLLLAGEGTYWDMARQGAGCKRSIKAGTEKLFTSAMAGDLEAGTALSHIWAERGSRRSDVFNGIKLDQIFALFKIAVTSQNAQAVMNMGVMWRYGVSCLQPDHAIAVDAFLMALQGSFFREARSLSARHLLETVEESQAEVVDTLVNLIACTRSEDESSTSTRNCKIACDA